MAYTRLYDAEMERITKNKIGASAIVTYMSLVSFDHKNKGYCNPSIDTLMQKMQGQYSRSSLEKALVKLQEAGLLIRGKRTAIDRFKLPVRSAAIDEFLAAAKVTEDPPEKVTIPEPVTCDGGTRNMLLHNTTNGIDSFLYYKPAIDEIRIARERFSPDSFPDKFLRTIEENYGLGKAPVKGQIPKLKEILRNAKRRPQIRELDGESKGGKGEHIESESADPIYPPDHPIHLPNSMPPMERIKYAREYWENLNDEI